MTGAVAHGRSVPRVEHPDPPTVSAASACLDWLLRMDPAPLGHDPRCALEAIALASLASHLSPTRRTQTDGFVGRIAEALPTDVWSQCDLLAALVAALAVVDCAPSRRGAGDYLGALSEIDPSDATAGAAALLVLAFDRSADVPPDIAEAPALTREHPEATASLLGQIERATLYGTRPVRAGPALAIRLEGAAMACLRRYDLLLGMRLLRAAGYLRTEGSLCLGSGLGFVRALQREDGGFGDFAAETPRPGAPAAVTRCRLDLAVAFSALWTLAELGRPGCRPIATLLRNDGRRWGGPC